jgi:hypothetical protein
MAREKTASQGITAKMTIINVATGAGITDSVANRCETALAFCLALYAEINFDRNLFRFIDSIFRVAVSLSSSDCTTLSFFLVSTRSYTPSAGFASMARRLSRYAGFTLASLSATAVFAFRSVLYDVPLLFWLRE